MSVILSYKTVKVIHNEIEFKHIHGVLDFEINGEPVPYLGYFSFEDVCFNTWFSELSNLILSYQEGEKTYLFDEGEQGQPAYQFDFEGESCFLSIVDSPLSETEGDPDWHRVSFEMADLIRAFDSMKLVFLNEVQVKAPDSLPHWQAILKA